MGAAAAGPAILDDELLAMDVADTLRHHPELAAAPDPAERNARLRELYGQWGLVLSDAALSAGVAAAGEHRFRYDPPTRGVAATLSRLYVIRDKWLPPAVAVAIMFVIAFGGFFLIYRPWHEAQVRQAELELSEGMPAQMDALYQTIFEETKVQQAANSAAEIRARGKDAAKAGDRAGAQQAIDELTAIRDTLRAEYQLKIVDRQGAKWGFWSFPESNSEATNYYIIVEPLDSGGKALSLPIRNEETGRTETVSMWAERVPEEIYRAVEADKDDDGVIEHDLVAIKDFGFLEPDYLVQVLGGQVTRW